jgi:hypothetical protein
MKYGLIRTSSPAHTVVLCLNTEDSEIHRERNSDLLRSLGLLRFSGHGVGDNNSASPIGGGA